MDNAPKRRTSPWIAFLAGAVVMLALGLLIFAWQGTDDAAKGVRVAARAAQALPDLPEPRLPQAPRLPDAPIPLPK